MADKVAGTYTVRGVMKRGRVELLEDIEIEDGSLLDVVVVKTGTQVRMEEKAAGRSTGEPSSLRFSLTGKPKSADPLNIFRSVPKSNPARMRFEGFHCTPSIVADDVQLALAQYCLAISDPPPDVAKALQRAMRGRQRMAFSPGSKAAEVQRNALLALLEEQNVDDENQLALWHLAAAACTGSPQCIPGILAELPIDAAEMVVCRERRHRTGGHEEEALRGILLDEVIGAVRRSRRALSGTTETEKLMRKEHGEIVEQLMIAREQYP